MKKATKSTKPEAAPTVRVRRRRGKGRGAAGGLWTPQFKRELEEGVRRFWARRGVLK